MVMLHSILEFENDLLILAEFCDRTMQIGNKPLLCIYNHN